MTSFATTAGTHTTTPTWAGASQRPPAPRASRAPRRLLTEPKLVPLTLAESALIIEVGAEEPAWFYSTLSGLQQLSQLGDNWDSYGSRPPHDDVIVTALDLIARLLSYDSTPPAIVPTSEGGVQLAWHRGGHELEIRLRADGEISAFRFDEAAGQGATVERISLSDLGPLVALTGRL